MQKLKKQNNLIVALVLVFASLTPLLINKPVAAYTLLTSREVRMASSVAGLTDVTYLVRVTTPSTQTIGSIVIDFCSNSPNIGDSCTAPSGFNINEAGLAIPTASQSGITDWTITPHANSDTNTVVLTRTASSFTAGTLTFELGSSGGTDGITNPTAAQPANTTFFARILTYADADDDGDGCSAADDSAVCYPTVDNTAQSLHAGGAAMSTNDQISIQSKVQERLAFCVYTSAAVYNNCAVSATNPVVLGDANGVLDPSNAYVSKATKYNIMTNAANGASIRAKGTTLTSGANTITGIGATAAASSVGTEQFGFCNYRDTGGGSATLTPSAPYNHANCSSTTQGLNGASTAQFAFDTTTACGASAGTATFGEGNLGCLYGDPIATKTAGDFSTGIVAFIGNISLTTEPGIYTTTMTFIATGNY